MKHFIHYFSEDTSVRLDAFITERSTEIEYLDVDRPAVIVCPGGGYSCCSDREAEPVALKYAAAGFQVFILRYTVGEKAVFPTSLIDLGKTIKLIRDHAEEWAVIPHQIAVCGFSAGGHLAASLGVYWNDPAIGKACGATAKELRPDLLILGYPVISTSWMETYDQYARVSGNPDDAELYKKLNLHTAVDETTPPAFITHGTADPGVPVRDSLRFACALEEHNVPVELHLFSHAQHGFSVSDETCYARGQADDTIAEWVPLSIAWLKRNFFGGELGKPVNKGKYSSNY
ncbi:MAG: alpha/beta hydrolase [Clostridia bacterium]|nr:alpha/beta hydrolase [Clostridia bacterium]